jgi:hypothetical protein
VCRLLLSVAEQTHVNNNLHVIPSRKDPVVRQKTLKTLAQPFADAANDMFVFLLLFLLSNIDTDRNRYGSMNILNSVSMQIYFLMKDCSVPRRILLLFKLFRAKR